MSYLNNLGIERWRAKSALPGAKRELQTQARMLSDANGPRLLMLRAEEQCCPNTALLFDNLCNAIQVTYGLAKADVAFSMARHPDFPTLLLGDDCAFEANIEACHNLAAGLQDCSIKQMWWQAINDMLCAST